MPSAARSSQWSWPYCRGPGAGTGHVLHDLDLGTAGDGETHRLNAPLADLVNAFVEHPDGGAEGPVQTESQ